MALFSRFQRTCSSRVGSASRRIGSSGRSTVNSWPRSSSADRTDLDRAPDHRGQVDDLLAELDLAPADPGDVHQVVDQPGEVDHLPLGHRPLGLDPSAVPVRLSHQVEGVADRGERVAELVGERGEELVLAAVGLGQFLHAASQLALQPLAFVDVLDDGDDPGRSSLASRISETATRAQTVEPSLRT